MEEITHEERAARIVWAAHILSYVSRNRSHSELNRHDADPQELDDLIPDYQSDKTAVLTGPKNSVRQKYLDCIAQLLSPCKGWDGVTATAIRECEDIVEIDVARNDCFVCDDGTIDYCRDLEKYLQTAAQDNSEAFQSKFELKVVDYMSRRIDHWINDLRAIWTSVRSQDNINQLQAPGLGQAVEKWKYMADFLSRLDDVDVEELRNLIVYQAYTCVKYEAVQQILQNAFGNKISSKLWIRLNLIARPILDCRLLQSIASRESQYRHVRISLVHSRTRTTVNEEHRVSISEAMTQLGLNLASDSQLRVLNSFDKDFKKACTQPYTQHAEMQLISHYENGTALPPTSDYFGCSKKTCLLCETFLNGLPRPIATRGRHGICYPAWGLPCSTSNATNVGLNALEKVLLSLISEGRYSENVLQSDIVSDFSRFTIEEWQRKEQNIELWRNKEEMRRNELLISNGLAPTSRSTNEPRQLFEPEDSCVMCNSSPARLCSRCRSCYYCSRDCQKSDYSSHKLLCRQYYSQSPRPSAEHKRATYFPADEAEPHVIWVACRRETDEDGFSWTSIDLSSYLRTDNPMKGTLRVEYNPVRDRNLGSGFVKWAPLKDGYCVSLIHRDAYLMDGSSNNMSISAAIKRSGLLQNLSHQYGGPMIAIRELIGESYADITLGDFRHLIDYLVSYLSTNIRESITDQIHCAPTVTRGVKICCYGDVKLHGSKQFVSVEVTRATRITLGDGDISPISSRLGMPLLLWKYPDFEFAFDRAGWSESMQPESNQNAAFLMKDIDPSRPQWGWAPLYWSIDIGNVLVLRKEREDLSLDHLSMMANFVRNTLQPMLEDTMGTGPNSDEKLKVLDFITWENMVRYGSESSESSG